MYLMLLALVAVVGWGLYVTLAGRELLSFDVMPDGAAPSGR